MASKSTEFAIGILSSLAYSLRVRAYWCATTLGTYPEYLCPPPQILNFLQSRMQIYVVRQLR